MSKTADIFADVMRNGAARISSEPLSSDDSPLRRTRSTSTARPVLRKKSVRHARSKSDDEASKPVRSYVRRVDGKVRESRSHRNSHSAADTESEKEKVHGKPPKMYRDPTLRARVPRHVLEGGNAPPFRHKLLARVARSIRPSKAVKVEALRSGLSTSVLYAPEGNDARGTFAPTQLVSNRPRPDDRNIVYQDSAFEIRVAGMLVRNYDRWGPSGDNELLMYSIQTDPSTAGDANQSLPFIHYDFQRDGSESANTYVPIPASKSYVMSSGGIGGASVKLPTTKKRTAQSTAAPKTKPVKTASRVPSTFAARPKKSVNVQFRILEIDNPSEMIKQAVSGIDELGGFISSFSAAAPFVGMLSPALGLASAVSKRALDSYAQPDKVISIDMDFLLASRERVRKGTAPAGEYLRYGYYFFLSEPIEGKLYASVRTPKNVQLMFRRCDDDLHAPTTISGDPVATRRYFPLVEVSYLVVRVVEPTGAGQVNRRPIQMSHAHALEDIFKRTKLDDDPVEIRNAIWNLGHDLGILDSDSDSGSPVAAVPLKKGRVRP